MEDLLRRLSSLEKDVSVIKTGVGSIKAQLPHLATRADLALVRGDVSAIRAQIPHLAATADVAQVPHLTINADVPSVRTHLRNAKVSIIRWIVSAILVEAALVFIIARYIH